jgi:hypothetical protein
MTYLRNSKFHTSAALRRLVVVAMSAALLLTTVTTTAAAAVAAKPTDDTAKFAAQAKHAGLSAAEARTLQARVDKVLATLGGKQTAANEVLWKNGSGSTTVVLPGEQRARTLGTNSGPGEWWGCLYRYLCLWEAPNSGGNKHSLFNCEDYYTPYPIGSWVNHQTNGTVGVFKDYYRTPFYWTGPAPNTYPNFPYGYNTWYVRPCP